MNAVEIEEAVSRLASAPFDPQNFPFAFLEAFGNKSTTIARLRKMGRDSTNQSDIGGKLKTDFRYSNTLGWNTFPVPTLTDQNKPTSPVAPKTSC
jgi:hypothetical protein